MFINDVPIDCISQASYRFQVPALVIVAVLKTENGHVGTAKINKNGTVDYGPMQINSCWLKALSKYGYTVHDLQYDACLNVNAGTWILAQEIAKNQSIAIGLGNYHSHSVKENIYYQYKVDTIVKYLGKILSGN